MRKKQDDFLRKFAIGVMAPVALLAAVALTGKTEALPEDTQPSQTQASQESAKYGIVVVSGEEEQAMELETYLVGVVLGEVPASFETEALKAQAVAARTYALKQCLEGTHHGAGRVCTDYTCCQAYISVQDYLAAGGTETAVERVRQAVADTAGQVLVYEDELIYATFFSCAGDATEDAVAVWGQDYPYLKSVPSPGEEDAVFYTETVTFSAEEFQSALGVRLEGAVDSWFGAVTYTEGGGVDTLRICGVSYQGTTLRTLLGLRSTAFTITVRSGQIIIQTKGYGHRVGMSQYGANAMAKAGSGYEEILTYYYTGAQIQQFVYE